MNQRVALFTVMLLVAAAPAMAQRRAYHETPRPNWHPTRIPDVVWKNSYLTKAEEAIVFARLDAIAQLFYAIPELGHPEGFELVPWFQIGDKPAAGYVVQYGFTLAFYHKSYQASGGDATCSISVNININANPDAESKTQGGEDVTGRLIYFEPLNGSPFPGATHVFYGDLPPTPSPRCSPKIIFTRDRMSPWLPVTREDFYHAVIFWLEGKNGQKVAEVRKAFAKTPYEQWLADAPQRKKDREATYQMLAMQGREAVANARKTIEESDRKIEAELKANDARDRAAYQEQVKNADAAGNRVQAALDSMSAAERKQPAIIGAGPAGATGYEMASAQGPYTHRVVTPNFDFWRARKSRVEVRGVELYFSSSDDETMHNAVWQAYKKLDWDALRALVQ